MRLRSSSDSQVWERPAPRTRSKHNGEIWIRERNKLSWDHGTVWVAFDSVNGMANIWTRVENDNSISEQHGLSETIWFTTYDSPTTISSSTRRPNLSSKTHESAYVIFWLKILHLNVKISKHRTINFYWSIVYLQCLLILTFRWRILSQKIT